MKQNKRLSRRQFIRAGVSSAAAVAAGSVGAWSLWKNHQGAKLTRHVQPAAPDDWSRFIHTDPSLLRYRPAGAFSAELRRPRRIILDAQNRVLLAGDTAVLVMDDSGNVQHVIQLNRPPFALAAGADNSLYIALHDHVVMTDPTGALTGSWPRLGEKSWITSIAFAGQHAYLGDAGNREVLKSDLTGRVVSKFGKRGSHDGSPGFIVPSPYLDITPGADQASLLINNPGRHQVERYTLDGAFIGAWGATSFDPEDFCGCCNPVYVHMLPDDRIITSEKGMNRVKLYEPSGKFIGFVAGADHLGGDTAAAQRATDDCRQGCGFDIASGSNGRVFVLDTIQRLVRIFEPIA